MPMTDAEQYMLELLNRARLDPLGEAKRQGTALNTGLPSSMNGKIDGNPKQVLAPLEALDKAATGHSQWMADTNTFSHVGKGGSAYDDRILAAGYEKSYYGWALGENLSYGAGIGTATERAMQVHFNTLWNSPDHRYNMMQERYREIGIAEVYGKADFVTLDFGLASERAWVTGVAYTDRDRDGFYSIGEGQSGLAFTILKGNAETTGSTGGYALSAKARSELTLQIGGDIAVGVDLGKGNVKVDLVNGSVLKVSGDVTLIEGISRAELLGMVAAGLTGNDKRNVLIGNESRNTLAGEAGNDVLRAGGGSDRLSGGNGCDQLYGDAGNDSLSGGRHADKLFGGDGKDRLVGDGEADKLYGGHDADTFVLRKGFGTDRAMDFNLSEGDRLALDDNLWSGNLTPWQIVNTFATATDAGVVFDFGRGNLLVLEDVYTTDGLAARIGIF